MQVGRTIQEGRVGWSPERIAKSDRAQVYAVATAARMGRQDLATVRIAAALEDEREPVVRLARWFDAETYPLPARLSVAEALAALDEQGFPAEVVAAFRAVQPLIQPVGLE